MKIKELLNKCDNLTLLFGDETHEVLSVEYDSRKVTEGSLFVAVEGLVVDGHKFIDKAVESRAAAVIVSSDRAEKFHHLKDSGVTLLTSSDTRNILGAVSEVFCGFPSEKLHVIGITGTNGKTSITYMLESIFKFAGKKTGVIGTVNYRWNDKEVPAPNTTPESRDIQYLLKSMVDDGVEVVFMEVSSHGLHLGRVDHVNFCGGVFTNLTRDHMDYHKDFESYFKAKKILFQLINKSKFEKTFGVVNIDDEYGLKLLNSKEEFNYPLAGFGTDNRADYYLKEESLDNSIDGIRYDLKVDNSDIEILLNLAGKFSVYNSVAALSAAYLYGLPMEKIKEGIGRLENIPGRFDKIKSNEGFYVIVDYAHTNDALKKVLTSARELKPETLITIFGCGGDRDKTKRPIMGQVAMEYSDYVIVTSDNPRTEDPAAILEDIEEGIKDFIANSEIEKNREKKYEVEIDREKAIEAAINRAEKGDLVVIAGKGHEDYQILGTEKIHFDDKEMARKYIDQRISGK